MADSDLRVVEAQILGTEAALVLLLVLLLKAGTLDDALQSDFGASPRHGAPWRNILLTHWMAAATPAVGIARAG